MTGRLVRVLKVVPTAAVLSAVFPLLAFFAPQEFALRSGNEHALLDVGIALSACFCSLQALVRYQSRPQPLFLWLGAGFLASGVLDGVHAMLSLQIVPGPDRGNSAGPLIWAASSLTLALYLALSLRRESSVTQERMQYGAVLVGGGTALLLGLVSFLLLSHPPPMLSVFGEHRPYDLLAGIAMLLVLLLMWQRRHYFDPLLRPRLISAVVLYASLHAGVAAWSSSPLDVYVAISHLAKLLAQWLVLVGLLQSSANLLTEAEASRERLAVQADKLEASERHIRSIVDHAPYAILGADEDGYIRSINPVAERLFGVTEAEALGRPLNGFFDTTVHADLESTQRPDRRGDESILSQRPDGGAESSRSRWALSRQARGIKASGEIFPIALTLTDVVAGGQRFLTAFVRDLTQVLQQEQRTHAALMLATRILDQSSVAILSTDGNGVITRFNHTAQQWLGYSEAEVRGRMTPAWFLDSGELHARAKNLESHHNVRAMSDAEIVLAMARRGESDQQEWALVRKDGSRFPASVSVAPLTTEKGDVTGFVLVATDLSEQKEVERLKNEFVSTVSHELRTPLTSIRGSLGLLAGGLAGTLPAAAQNLLLIAQRNTERLILLINDILDIEKIEAGKMRFTFKQVELDGLIAEAVQTSEGLASTRSVKLVRRGRATNVRVHVDEQRLIQVMSNLLSNAIKFSPEGGTVAIDVAAHGGRARVTVTDHGAGIPEASQSRIFQKFFQADGSNAREKGGTGLGLSICQALIERMDGHIGFRSQPGETVFFFEIPHEIQAAAVESKHCALIVEGDADAAAVLSQILRKAGIDTEVAGSGSRARALIAKRRYDCLLLDLVLPDEDGVTVLGDLRRHEHGRTLPVIIVSIYEADAARQAALNVADWLTQPVDSERLLAAVRRVLPWVAAPAESSAIAAAQESAR